MPMATEINLPVYDTQQREDYDFGLPEALRLAMENSNVVRVETGGSVFAARETFYDVQAREAEVAAELATFDTQLQAGFASNMFQSPPDAFFGPGLAEPLQRDELTLNFGWTRRTALGGRTSALFNPDPGYLFLPGDASGSFNPRHIGELEFSITQPLLRGAGLAVNLAPVEIRQISTEQSVWEFKRATLSSVASVITAYWELYAAQIAVEAIEQILPLLDEIVRIQSEAFKAEWVTRTEVAKAEAQRFGFRRQYQELQSDRLAAELRLRNLIGLPPQDGRNLLAATAPLTKHVDIDLLDALQAAIDNQPDLLRRRLDIRIRTIEEMLARNGRRLQLDVFALARRNGIGESIDDALNQMLTEDFTDWQLGVNVSVPIHRRQANAEIRATQLRLARETELLQQAVFSIRHDLQDTQRSIEFAYRQYEESSKSLRSADDWVQGAKLRYENPDVANESSNVIVQNLNEYLNSLRFRTAVATERAELVAEYNAELVRLEEIKGTLLDYFGIEFLGDPSRHATCLPSVTFEPTAPDTDQPPPAEDGARSLRAVDPLEIWQGYEQRDQLSGNVWQYDAQRLPPPTPSARRQPPRQPELQRSEQLWPVPGQREPVWPELEPTQESRPSAQQLWQPAIGGSQGYDAAGRSLFVHRQVSQEASRHYLGNVRANNVEPEPQSRNIWIGTQDSRVLPGNHWGSSIDPTKVWTTPVTALTAATSLASTTPMAPASIMTAATSARPAQRTDFWGIAPETAPP